MNETTALALQTPEGIQESDTRMRHCLAAFTGKLLAIGTAETAIQLGILLYVADEDAERRTVRHMADCFSTSKPRITRNTDTLESLGYVTRQNDPRDRRSVIIKITPAGTRFLKQVAAAARDAFINNASTKPKATQPMKKAQRLAA